MNLETDKVEGDQTTPADDYSFVNSPAYKKMLQLPNYSPMRNMAPHRDVDTRLIRDRIKEYRK